MKKTLYLLFVLLFVPFILIGCGHTCDFGEWVTHIAPTYTTKGQEIRYCKGCDKYELREVPSLPYSYLLTTMVNDVPTYFYIQENGQYDIGTTTVEGYEFLGWVDKDGNDFASSGTISESTTVYAKLQTKETTTFEQLKIRLESGAKDIYLNADFELSDTIYIHNSATIYVKKDCTLTRNKDFLGDLFVIGQDAYGKNPLLENKKVTVTIKTENSATLTFDGNKSNIQNAVKGTAFYITNSSILEIYENVTIQNFKKTTNERIVNEFGAIWDTANMAGGSAVMINYGTFNMYGGMITDNEVNLLDSEPNPDLPEGSYDSSYGGAIFNRSTFNMFGGTIKNSQAGRGGAIYNYRAATISAGEITNNYATSYGGAVYMPNSQSSTLKIGQDSKEELVKFSKNHSDYSGGAIFAQTLSNLAIFGGTTFEENKNLTGNGGAICTSGPCLTYNTVFNKNEAEGKGGAVYIYYRDKDNSVRLSNFEDCTFTYNKAEYGAGISLFASDSDFGQGAIATIKNCLFENNEVTSNGGAVYAGRSSKVTMSDCTFNYNKSASTEYGGGAMYFTNSIGELSNLIFNENSSTNNAGALAIYSSSTVTATDLKFNKNSATKSGGAIFVSKSTFTNSNGIEFKNNTAGTTGGGLTAYSSSKVTLNNAIVAEGNTSTANGGFIYNSGSTISLSEAEDASIVKLNVAGECGGAVAVHSAGTFNSNNIKYQSNEATDVGGALYVKGATANIGMNDVEKENVFDLNKAKNGGAIYLETSTTNDLVFNACKLTLTNNTATTNAGGLYIKTDNDTTASATIEYLTATGNSCTNNGGALYAYTNSTVLIKNLLASTNKSSNYGGFAYISGAADVEIQAVDATKNESGKGGFVYITTTATELRILSGKIKENEATEGSVLYSNSAKAVIRFKGGAETTEIEYDSDGITGKSAVTILDIEGEE